MLNGKLLIQGSNLAVYNKYSPQVTAGSILNLDAGNTTSYSGTGTEWYDISGQGMTASLVNTPTYQSNSGSFKLNGTNQYMVVTPNATLNAINAFTNSYTFEIWAKSTDPSPTNTFAPRLIEKRALTGAYPISIQINFNFAERTTCFVFDGTLAPGVQIDGQNLWDGTWKQITYVVDFSSDSFRSYNNSGFVSSSTNTVTTNTSNASNLYIGTNGAATTPFAGEIAIVRVYNTALTVDQIGANWFATKDRFGV